jgi:hypothetical protein
MAKASAMPPASIRWIQAGKCTDGRNAPSVNCRISVDRPGHVACVNGLHDNDNNVASRPMDLPVGAFRRGAGDTALARAVPALHLLDL